MDDSDNLTRTEASPNAGPSRTREDDDHAVQDILMRLRKGMALAKGTVRMDDLHTVISLLRDALEDATYGEENHPIVKYHLVKALLTRYGLCSSLEDLDECFRHSEGIECVFASTDKSGRIGEIQIMVQLLEECRNSIDVGALNAAISSAEEDISSYLDDCPTLRKAEVLTELGNALAIKSFSDGGIKELDQAAKKLQEAERMCCGQFPHVNTSLTSRAYVEILRFMECSKIEASFQQHDHTTTNPGIDNNDPSNVDSPIGEEQLQSTLAFLRTSSHDCVIPQPQQLSPSYHLARALLIRSMLKGDSRDLERCILLNREALKLRPVHHPSRALSLNSLSEALLNRSQMLDNLKDLEEGISLLRESVKLHQDHLKHPPTFLDNLTAPTTPVTSCHPQTSNESSGEASTPAQMAMPMHDPSYHPEYSLSLNHLALALVARFNKKGSIQDLDESILHFREGLDLPPTSRSDRPLSQIHLANALLSRFKRKGESKDIEDSVTVLREALDLQPTPHPGRSASLSNLANSLLNRFWHKGVFQDLEDSILLLREALDLQRTPHPGRSITLVSLANALLAHFCRRGGVRNLEDSIAALQEALDLQPTPHPGRSITLNNLADALNTRFKHMHAFQDLEHSIALSREALDLQPTPHPERASSLGNLASSLFIRFKKKGVPQDLQESIQLIQESLDLQPLHYPGRSASLSLLAKALDARSDQTRHPQDLEDCIMLHRQTLHLRSASHPDRPSSLDGLADALFMRFRWHGGAFQDLEECIALHREVLDLRLPPDPNRPASLRKLASVLRSRFMRKGSFRDLEECIALNREALDLQPTTHPDRSSSLDDLASALLISFKHKGIIQELEECISLHREALDQQPTPHPGRPVSLNNLASALHTSFTHTGLIQQLDESISVHREALKLQPRPHSDRSTSLNNLAGALITSFELRGLVQDLEESIELHREALDLRQVPHPERPFSLNNLAGALVARFEQRGDFKDLEKSITLRREALDLLPPPHLRRVSVLNNLAHSLHTRFHQKGEFRDLDECIILYEEALDLRPVPHPDRSMSLNNLAGALSTRFEHRGNSKDLEESIVLYQEALVLRPIPHPGRSLSLDNLASSLRTRFQQKGDFQDLEECIVLHREALDLRSAAHINRDLCLNNLAFALNIRFEEKKAVQDLEESITLYREALNLRHIGHPQRATSLNNLSSVLLARFNQNGASEDLQECISLQQQALNLLDTCHQARSSILNTLAAAFDARFLQNGTPEDIEKSIVLLHEALDLQPPPHTGRFRSLHNLARTLIARSEREPGRRRYLWIMYPYEILTNLFRRWFLSRRNNADINNALRHFEEASRYETGPLLGRLRTSVLWAAYTLKYRPGSALPAYQYAVELLPLLASLDLTLRQRQDVLEHTRALVGHAAKCAIKANQFETAVILLSTGRTIFWSQTLQLRAQTDQLRLKKPELAEKLLTVSKQLERASYSDLGFVSDSSTRMVSMVDPGYTSPSTLVTQRDQTISEIRGIPGFEDFLLPPSFASLQGAADAGAVVLLNASDLGCDALIMHRNGVVKHVSLSEIHIDELEELKMIVNALLDAGERSINISQSRADVLRTLLGRDIGPASSNPSSHITFQMVLKYLWNKIVEPVVRMLGIEKTSSPGRIWWCRTGPFAMLPIHAAGIYAEDDEPIDCLFQYAVSSYCISPQDLLHPPPAITKDFKMTAIIEPEVPNAQPLPATREELKKIKKNIPERHHLLVHVGSKESPTAPTDRFLSDIRHSSFVHFGCHGMQNLNNPLESYLLLSGGKLTMSRIIKEYQVPDGALAYLSACETAKGDEARPDESLNLVATMMFAGFRSVVGTMWSILDQDAPIVADVFYEHLFRRGTEAPPDVRDAALGLHLATEKLRSNGATFYRWIPYVHYGI